MACTGAEGCLENVEINLPGVKDEQAKADFEAQSNELRSVYAVLRGGTDG